MDEFELIERYFRGAGAPRDDVLLGIGDDGAVLALPGRQVVVVDTLIGGRHFPDDAPAASVGHRALAVNLSDIAAMGAVPTHALLALTLPRAEPAWLDEFAAGLGALARRHGVALVGGDTTCGPLAITLTLLGRLPDGVELRRSGAQIGDAVFVSGTPGDAAYGLRIAGGLTPHGLDPSCAAELRRRFEYPEPRVLLGPALIGLATSCIDVSDGLGGDLAKVAAASGVAIEIDAARLPLSAALRAAVPVEEAQRLALEGGDDYELAFTVPRAVAAQLPQRVAALAPVTEIGRVVAGSGVALRQNGRVRPFTHRGFMHFSAGGGR
ncbi:MAG: thiamine-phosphate kinase [Steroidobacteraceae bacterium]|nr:thiamine-phosphate kinase [Steroidobacteraceae bacterium]MDW8258146.1 thiamine-phosphate kinase [Gammaproteobacteria bacterium]